jgi:NAD+ diphosphatase
MSTEPFAPGVSPPPEVDKAPPLGLLVTGTDVVVTIDGDEVTLPDRVAVEPLAEQGAASWLYLGTLGDQRCYAAALGPAEAQVPPPFARVPVRELFERLDAARLAAVGQALALVEWDTMHRHCGRCAAATVRDDEHRVRRCPRCAATFHPRIPPAVIVLVTRGSQMLLARNVRFPPGRFSAVAGFAEPGESLEQAARREVREEVGVEVAELRYFGSQPWPFGHSLMIGFVADHAGGDIRVDGEEIVEAAWFSVDRLPDLPPPISIARQLIDVFVSERTPALATVSSTPTR